MRCTIICTDEDGERCPRPKIAHDWCQRHHTRWTRTGHPLGNRSKVGKYRLCHFCPEDVDIEKRRAVGSDGEGRPLCRKHYNRWYRYGDALATKRRSFTYTGDPETDFWALVDTKGGDVDQCWPWLGTITVHGYGSFQHAPAHRIAYQLMRGEIPKGLVIDHTCHDPRTCRIREKCQHRRCVNPWHGEAVTQAENVAPHRTINGRPLDDDCDVAECDEPYIAMVDGVLVCTGHYQRVRRHGDAQADRPLLKRKRRSGRASAA